MNDMTVQVVPVVAVAELETAEVAPVVARAYSLVISTPEDYSEAAEELKKNKGMQKRIDAKLIDPWRKSKANATANMKEWDDLLMVPLRKAEGILKTKQLAYDAEKERARLAEERRLQAIEDERTRKEQERADALVRAQREKEQAALRAQQEALQRAQNATNAEARAKAQAEAEKASKAAAAAAAKAAEREEAAAAVGPATVITVASEVPKVAGQHKVKKWKGRVVDPRAAVKALFAQADWAAYIKLDQGAIDAFAARTSGNTPMDGILFVEEVTLASSSR